MPLLLPNLDDRRWADLVDEGRALIPVYGPEWTDHNAHDPGITLVELIAWIAEMDIYQLNRISDADRRKFLNLVGVTPRPPLPARAILSATVNSPDSVDLPAGVEFTQTNPSTPPLLFRTLRSATLVPGSLDALQFRDAKGFQNLTPSWLRHRVLYPLGPAPQPSMEFYLGFSKALPVGASADLYFTFADGRSGSVERDRLLDEAEISANSCRPPSANNPCQEAKPANSAEPEKSKEQAALLHHGVRTVWEFRTVVNGQKQWQKLNPANGEVKDDTRSLTLDAKVTFRLPSVMALDTLGSVSAALFYLRCRIDAGVYDAAPQLLDIAFNGVPALQSVPSWTPFVICPNAPVTYSSGGAPKPNDLSTLRVELDSRRRIISLVFGGGKPKDPAFRILEYRPPTATAAGLLSIEAVFLGFGNGMPSQQVTLPDVPVEKSSVHLYTLENDDWNEWQIRPDFDSSSRRDFHAMLEPSSGNVIFGNGEKGRIPPEIRKAGAAQVEKCLIFAVADTTQASYGNVAPGTITQLADTAHNHALLYKAPPLPDGWADLKSKLNTVSNPLPATGGAEEETIALASGRADKLVTSSPRAVTLADYERLALQTPGTRVARAKAIANLHPSFPCFEAPGLITVVVIPYLPLGLPSPSPGLLRAIAGYLRRRRVIGTRVEVVGPSYVEVAVRATVQSKKGINKTALQQSIERALNTFMDPLSGGPDGKGWPFGRDVYRSEILRVIDDVPGVDHVLSMDLLTGGCEATCGNVCLGPISLVAAGAHEITVL